MSFTSLPPEVVGLVIKQIPDRHDLCQLSMVCKTLHAIVVPRLYSHLILKVPRNRIRLDYLENLLSSPGEGLQHVRSLRITTQLIDKDDADPDDVSPDEEEEPIGKVACSPITPMSAHLNSLVRILLKRIPRVHLTEFIWDHRCAIQFVTLKRLAKAQCGSLSVLTISAHDDISKKLGWDTFDLPDLRSFSLSTFDRDISGACFGSVITNSTSLEHLCLGAESSAYRFHNGLYPRFRTDMDEVLHEMVELIDVVIAILHKEGPTDVYWFTLTTLELKGLNVSMLMKPGFMVLDGTVYHGSRNGPPVPLMLKTLGIGSLFYQDIRNTIPQEHDKKLDLLHRFIRLQIYTVDHWHQFNGQRKAFATHIETGTYEETEADGRDVTIFKPYWLA
ncbi:MAG: hypothetical protein Q9216_007031 [Gyalolechia sp. 2 TL-2023]